LRRAARLRLRSPLRRVRRSRVPLSLAGGVRSGRERVKLNGDPDAMFYGPRRRRILRRLVRAQIDALGLTLNTMERVKPDCDVSEVVRSF
jgi:hypothetical protein